MKQLSDEQERKIRNALVEALETLDSQDDIGLFLDAVNRDEIQINLGTEKAKEIWARLGKK